MSDALGLSVGSTNLVAIRDGRPPVTRRSIVTFFNDRAPEVGVPGENPNLNQPGLVLTSFVDRVGDPVALVAPDGTSHRAEFVLVDALDAMARTVGGGAPVTIAVPAHWSPAVVGALRAALRTKPSLAPNGVAASIIPDSGAALTGLRTSPGLPPNGVVVLCDFGGSGTSITLADASAGLAFVGDTVRYPDFSGDLIDQALLNHVVVGIAEANQSDPASTAAVGSLARLRDECRRAKERLSSETATVLPAELPGYAADFRVTRSELERLIDESLGGLLNAVEDTLQRYRIPLSSISAVATVGGGAAIPLVTQRLSERLRAPVVTTPAPLLAIAAGAVVVADNGLAPDTPTGMGLVADAPTGLAPTMGWAADSPPTQQAPAPSDSGALAWSQDDAPGGEPLPYAGPDYESGFTGPTDARPEMVYAHDEEDERPDSEPLAWYKRPPILFAAAAAALLLAGTGLAVTLTSGTAGPGSPVTEVVTHTSTGPNGAITTSLETQTKSAESLQSQAPATTTTATQSESTTSPTTTTTSPTTTTTTTTTTTPTTTTTTTTMPTTTTATSTSTSSSVVPPPPPDPPDPPTSLVPNSAALPPPTAIPETTIPVLVPEQP